MASEEKSTPGWLENRAKKTEAMPDRSLFGSNMEPKRAGDDEKMKKIDVKKDNDILRFRPTVRPRPKLELPDYLKDKLPGDFVLDKSRSQIAHTKEQQERATSLLRCLEEKARYYQLDVVEQETKDERTRSARSALSHKHNPEDLQHAALMNGVGVNRRNYNRDKYQPKPPSHQYSYLGDPLRKGMDFNTRLRSDITPRRGMTGSVSASQSRRLGREVYPPYPETDGAIQISSTEKLPLNVQHMFGTKVCRNVLSDPSKIEKTRGRLQPVSSPPSKPTKPSSSCSTNPQVSDNYRLMGNIMRSNVIPGVDPNPYRSLAEESWRQEVFDQRHPVPDAFKYHRDHFMTWNEEVVIADRMTKAWAQKELEKAQAKAKAQES